MAPPVDRSGETAGRAETVRLWHELRLRHRLVCQMAEATFAGCPTAEVATLRRIAAAYAEYLLAWGEASLDLLAPTPPAGLSADRVRRLVARATTIERAATHPGPPPIPGRPAPVPVLPVPVGPMPVGPPNGRPALAGLVGEAGRLLIEVRRLLRDLDPDRPVSRRSRVDILTAWGRYDDHLIALRRQAEGGDEADLGPARLLRDELVRRLNVARSLA